MYWTAFVVLPRKALSHSWTAIKEQFDPIHKITCRTCCRTTCCRTTTARIINPHYNVVITRAHMNTTNIKLRGTAVRSHFSASNSKRFRYVNVPKPVFPCTRNCSTTYIDWTTTVVTIATFTTQNQISVMSFGKTSLLGKYENPPAMMRSHASVPKGKHFYVSLHMVPIQMLSELRSFLTSLLLYENIERGKLVTRWSAAPSLFLRLRLLVTLK